MSAAVLLPQQRFTRDEVYRMMDAGAFKGRFELLDGFIIDKMGQKPPHASTIQLLLKWLLPLTGIGLLRSQLPIDVATEDRARNEPEPDIAVLSCDKPEFKKRHPRGDELILVIEVADSSLRTDKIVKRGLYARAGVPEYWIVDLQNRCIVAHRTPAEGAYASIATFGENETISPESRPAAAILVSQILP